MELILIISAITIGWISLSAIIGTFGKGRTIGFVKIYFASFFLSPLLAMLFVLASDGKTGGRLTATERALFIVPIVLCLLSPFVMLGIEAHEEQQYARYLIEMENAETQKNIDFLRALNVSDFTQIIETNGDVSVSLTYSKLLKNENYDSNWDYAGLEWDTETELHEFRLSEIKKLNTKLIQQ